LQLSLTKPSDIVPASHAFLLISLSHRLRVQLLIAENECANGDQGRQSLSGSSILVRHWIISSPPAIN
jgi:hypothetical protein